jgi:copper chaperone
MVTFEINDMTCGHCVGTITKAVRSVDSGAKVEVDLLTHRVQIEAAESSTTALADAIKEAGYTPVPVVDAKGLAPKPAKSGGCCCR